MSDSSIVIKGAREHNLKDVDVEIPRDKLAVITGLSGSGKSSLAFDTIYAEGQRRYVESLSSYARQFLGRWTSPTSTRSTACRPRCPSTKRPPPRTRAPRWARSRRSTTTCACCTRASACRTAPSAGARSSARPPTRSPDKILEAGAGAPRLCARARGAGSQGRVHQAHGRPARRGLLARAHRRRGARSSYDTIELDKKFKHIEVVVDRIVIRDTSLSDCAVCGAGHEARARQRGRVPAARARRAGGRRGRSARLTRWPLPARSTATPSTTCNRLLLQRSVRRLP